MKEWEKLCRRYKVNDDEKTHPLRSKTSRVPKNDNEIATGEYEVSRIVDICYGDPNKTGKRGVNFKVSINASKMPDDNICKVIMGFYLQLHSETINHFRCS